MDITPSDLRAKLGERIPALGTDADTLFTDAEIIDLVNVYGEGAVLEGWRRKAAEYASLVDTAEGTSRRAMGQLHAHALEQISALEAGVGTTRRARVHRIVRDVD